MPPETGEGVDKFGLRNDGSASCMLRGYPGVRLLHKGRPLPFTYTWGGRYYGTRGKSKPVVLAPGHTGWFVVAKYRCDGRTLKLAGKIAVIPPNTSRRIERRLKRYSLFGYCNATDGPNQRDPGNTVQIGPVKARL
jgi:hypothetical protein